MTTQPKPQLKEVRRNEVYRVERQRHRSFISRLSRRLRVRIHR